jgi:hypothetical protein
MTKQRFDRDVSSVILSEAKDLLSANKILRSAQDDQFP